MATAKYPKLAKSFATEFTASQISVLLREFGRGGDIGPLALGSGCGQGCGNACGNNCRRAVGFVFDEFGYVNPSRKEMEAAAADPDGLRASVRTQIASLLG